MIWLLKWQLRSRLPAKRSAAVLQLAQNGSPRAIDAIVGALSDHQGWPRTVSVLAAKALGHLGAESAIPRLVQEFHAEENLSFCEAAAEALLAIGTPDAVEALCAIAEETGHLREYAVLSLMWAAADHPEIPRIVGTLGKVLLECRKYEAPEYSNATEGLARIFQKSDRPFSAELKDAISAHAENVLNRSSPKPFPTKETPNLLGALGNKKALVEYLLLPQSKEDLSEATIFVLVRMCGGERPSSFLSDHARGEWAFRWWSANAKVLVAWANEIAGSDSDSKVREKITDPDVSSGEES